MQVHDKLYIGGDWVAPAGTDVIEVISPHTEEVIGQVPDGTPADIDARRRRRPHARSTTADWPTHAARRAPRHRRSASATSTPPA